MLEIFGRKLSILFAEPRAGVRFVWLGMIGLVTFARIMGV
jgi:hypothetical protein